MIRRRDFRGGDGSDLLGRICCTLSSIARVFSPILNLCIFFCVIASVSSPQVVKYLNLMKVDLDNGSIVNIFL